MAKPQRSPERATKVIERAARSKKFRKVPLLERRLGDPQMRTVAYDPTAIRPDRLEGRNVERIGKVVVPMDKIRTSQPSVSIKEVKGKIANPGPHPPQLLRRPDGLWDVVDGNHRITAARAQGQTKVVAWGGVLRGDPGRPVAAAVNTYKSVSPVLQAAGVVAAASTAYNAARDANATRGQALGVAAKAAAPAIAMAAAAPALARFAPSVASGMAKANPVILGASLAYGIVKGAYEGYHEEKSRSLLDRVTGKPAQKGGWAGAAKGAAFGAADTLTFGLASYAAGRNVPYHERGSSLDTGRSKSFANANAKFEQTSASQAAAPNKPGYKDTWTDSRGRQYTRRNTAVRTRQNEAA